MTKNQIGNTFFIFIKKLKQKMKVLKKYGENFIRKRNDYIPYGYGGLNHKVQIFHSERLLEGYVERSNQVNHDRIEIQQLENHQVFFDVMSVRSLSYLQMQYMLWVRQ